jgi:hypothetical protein
LTAEIWARVQSTIRLWLQRVAALGDELDLMLATRQLVDDLRRIDPAIDLTEIRISTEIGDIDVVQNGRGRADGASGN